MIIAGAVLIVLGVSSAGYGLHLNNDVETMLIHTLSGGGKLAPGTGWIIAGTVVLAIGLVLLVLGFIKRSGSRRSTTFDPYASEYTGDTAENIPGLFSDDDVWENTGTNPYDSGYTETSGDSAYSPYNTPYNSGAQNDTYGQAPGFNYYNNGTGYGYDGTSGQASDYTDTGYGYDGTSGQASDYTDTGYGYGGINSGSVPGQNGYNMYPEMYPAETVPSTVPAKSPQRKKMILAACGVLVLAVIAVGTVLILRSSGSNDFGEAISRRIETEMATDSDLPLAYQYSNAILGSIRYSIVKSSRTGNIAQVEFRYPDIMSLADSLGDTAITADEYYQYCIDAISSGSAPFITKEIQVNFTEREVNGVSRLCVVDDLLFADVLSGGTVSALVEMMEENR